MVCGPADMHTCSAAAYPQGSMTRIARTCSWSWMISSVSEAVFCRGSLSHAKAAAGPCDASVWPAAFDSPLEAMYAAGLFQQSADGVPWLLAQQVGAERVCRGLRQQAAEGVRDTVAESPEVVPALSLHAID